MGSDGAPAPPRPGPPLGSGRELWWEIGMNVIAPIVVLTWLSGPHRLGPMGGMLTALAFPLAHAAGSILRGLRSPEGVHVSPLVILAVISVLLTGGIGLLELDTRWFAWKEAALPWVLGALVVGSLRTPWPALQILLSRLVDNERLGSLLSTRGTAARARQRMTRATWLLGGWMVISGALTFAFARYLVHSPAGTVEFNAELASYTLLSLPLIGLPVTGAMAWTLRGLLLGLEEDAGVPLEELLHPDLVQDG